MSDLKFADSHNMVAFLEKPTECEGFEQIVDFQNAPTIKYALTINPTIYASCIEQFWDTTKVKIVNEEVQIQALVDRKMVIIIEARKGSSNPTDPHHTPTIIQPSTSQPKKKQPRNSKKKNTKVPQSSGSTDDVADENVTNTSNDPPQSGEDRLNLNELIELFTNLSQRVLDLENTKTSQAAKITELKERVNKLEKKRGSRNHKLKRLYKVGRFARVVSSEDEGLGDHEDAS
ncbi:hypothetical protein Tco_1323060, partial [Tanacetum coccineum]